MEQNSINRCYCHFISDRTYGYLRFSYCSYSWSYHIFLVFAWENALRIRARKRTDEHGIKHYEIYGPLFFGSIELFNSKFDVKNDPQEVVVDFAESRVMDQSAIEALNKLAERYHKNGKTIHIRHLSSDCVKLIKKAEKICDINVLEDPNYFVAIDNYRQIVNKIGK